MKGGLVDRRQIGTKLALDAAGQPLDLDSFDGRLILQKTIYLMQMAGISLGYGFSWYLRGPYSRNLTRDAFDMSDELRWGDDSIDWELDEVSVKKIERLKALLFGKYAEDPAKRAKWLELLASAHFLIDTKQVDLKKPNSVPQIEDTLKKYNKDYKQSEIEEALECLEQHGLLPA